MSCALNRPTARHSAPCHLYTLPSSQTIWWCAVKLWRSPYFSLVFCSLNAPKTRLHTHGVIDTFSRRCCCYPKEPKLLSKGWSGWGPLALLQQLSSKSSYLIHRRLYRPSPKFRFKFTHHFRQVQTSLTPLYPSGDPSSIQD